MLSKMASGYCRSLLTSSIFRSFATRYINSRKIWECNRVATTLAMVRDVSGCTQFSHHWTAAHIRLLRVFSLRNVLSAQKLFTEAGAPFNEGDYPPLPEYKTDPGHESKDIFMVCVKGLPWSCTPEDLLEFFSECQIHDGVNGIHLTVNRDGRPNGEAVIELEQEEDIFKALQKHREYIGSRYVHVYEVSSSEAEDILRQSDQFLAQRRRMVKLQGLPYSCTEKDVAEFFSGLEIVPDGVALVTDHKRRNIGLAYVEFTSQEMAERAVAKDGNTMGTRYIDVLPVPIKSEVQSLKEEVSPSLPAATETDTHPESKDPNLGHFIHMRGLPFDVTGQDIVNFFSPVRLEKILIEHDANGRANGQAVVRFCSHEDAMAAMSKDKAHLQGQDVGLILNSPTMIGYDETEKR
ncbi:hypothetical protein COCON_G00154900 [Conger conger]|uniref:RRM domain-containing protein n=1 Tax=Conger conger TaxID=82655 RepID=A0A9Q1HV07_CONCO|nr:hypothetical protein COCON_G00154900 [Conger conger]